MYDIVILTESRYIKPNHPNWYIQQVLDEDQLLLDALLKNNINAIRKDWNDKNFDWNKTKYAIFRTTWDYFENFKEFLCWIKKTKKKTIFINSAEIIHWNIDKKYLIDLSKKGINISPTLFINKKTKTSLTSLFKKTKWKTAIIKPSISGAARHTYKITASNYLNYEKIFNQLIKKECMLFQQFLDNVITHGEISLIFIGKEYTHAVIKKAKDGDFRVQDDHGGTVEIYHPTKDEILFGKKCLKAIPFQPTYSRIDIIKDNNNNPSLVELELIEPELWFRNYPEAAKKLAKEITKKINLEQGN